MSDKQAIITIDGPSGGGKSTISRMVAAKLHYTYLDTGAMYRAVGLKVKQEGINVDSEDDRDRLKFLLDTIDITLTPAEKEDEDSRVFLNDVEVSGDIRTPEMGMIASRVSAEPEVRVKLTELQRQMGEKGGIVAEGRDTGTVVFPKAECKFYLDASAEERARRRQLQLMEKGQSVNFEELLAQIVKRDNDDSSRSHAPLKAADDAVRVDTTSMSIDEVVSFMVGMVLKSTIS